jgi:hypothetical protein
VAIEPLLARCDNALEVDRRFSLARKAALGGGLSFRLAASRFRGRGKDLRRDLSFGIPSQKGARR